MCLWHWCWPNWILVVSAGVVEANWQGERNGHEPTHFTTRFKNVVSDWSDEVTVNRVNFFEKGIRFPGRSELRLAASRPCRLQLIAAHEQSGQWYCTMGPVMNCGSDCVKCQSNFLVEVKERTALRVPNPWADVWNQRDSECERGVPPSTKGCLGRSVETGTQGIPQGIATASAVVFGDADQINDFRITWV
jgi:hypothetical protein